MKYQEKIPTYFPDTIEQKATQASFFALEIEPFYLLVYHGEENDSETHPKVRLWLWQYSTLCLRFETLFLLRSSDRFYEFLFIF